MLKIAVDAREFVVPGRSTGIGRFLENLVAPLAGGENDLEFTLLAQHPGAVPDRLTRLPAVTVHALPHGQPQWVGQWVLPRVADRLNADIIYSPHYKAPLFSPLPVVMTIHDIMFLRLRTLPPLVYSATKAALRAALRRCEKVIVVSRFSERDLVDMFPCAEEKTVVLYSDLGDEWHRLLRASTGPPPRPEFPVPDRFLLYVGTFMPHKNVDLLVHAYEAAVASGELEPFELLLVGGDDRHEPAVRRLITKRGLDSRIHVYRDIDDATLSHLYKKAEWFVTASAYEGFGYPCVEAMVSGCPVICHQTTSLIEVVGSAALPIAALTVEEVATSMIRAAQAGTEDRQTFIDAGRRQARLFTPGQTSAAFGALCRTVVQIPS